MIHVMSRISSITLQMITWVHFVQPSGASKTLTCVIVTRVKKDLKTISELYLKRNNVSLDQALAKETLGDYKTFLLALLGHLET